MLLVDTKNVFNSIILESYGPVVPAFSLILTRVILHCRLMDVLIVCLVKKVIPKGTPS